MDREKVKELTWNKSKMVKGILNELIRPLTRKAVDARLVKSASNPFSNEGLKGIREKRNSPKGKLNKNGKPLKFSRDIESDWTIKNDKPHYGLKGMIRLML